MNEVVNKNFTPLHSILHTTSLFTLHTSLFTSPPKSTIILSNAFYGRLYEA